MKILIAYFSWRGATHRVAARLRDDAAGHEVLFLRIAPRRDRKYWRWLMLSLFPGSSVDIDLGAIEASKYDLILVGSPKWTVSCPPFNRLLRRLSGTTGKPVGYFMTYGGFDAERYVRATLKALESMGMKPIGSLAVKRRLTEGPEYLPLVDEFWRLVERAVREGDRDRP